MTDIDDLEVTCTDCGRRNISWSIDSDRWNFVVRANEDTEPMLCPSCFVLRHEKVTGLVASWTLVPVTPFRWMEPVKYQVADPWEHAQPWSTPRELPSPYFLLSHGGTVTDTDDRLCDVCFQLVPDEEAHLPHELGCSQEGCRCDFHVHPECCWHCEPDPARPGHRRDTPLPKVTWGSLTAIRRAPTEGP